MVWLGHASYAGILSAWLAKEGFRGPSSIFEEKFGLFNTRSQDVQAGNAMKAWGPRFEISDTYTKLYPTCPTYHPAIVESVFSLKERMRLHPGGNKQNVVVGTHEWR